MNNLTAQFNTEKQGSMFQVASSREMEEVKGQIFMAQVNPRDQFKAEQRIIDACKRLSLAQTAVYQYPRGGQKVTGPSIRLAEVLAQNWGNISFGVKELEQRSGESIMMAYAWDCETNTRVEKIFNVPHRRTTKKGIQKLTDERDIYELGANMGSRRVRACILSVIPGDIVESAIRQCYSTIENGQDEPIKDRIKKMLTSFKEKYGITQEQIEKRFGYKADSFTEYDLIQATNIRNSLKDNMTKIEDWFEKDSKKTNTLEKSFKEEKKETKKEVATDDIKQP
jgi:transcriptional regulator with XRE-family HTH domain